MQHIAYLINGCRSPFGRCGGGLAGVRADDLAASGIAVLIQHNKIPPVRAIDLITGCADQAMGRNLESSLPPASVP